MTPRRVDAAGGALILDVTEGTFRKYKTRYDDFPTPTADGRYDPAQLRAWQKARPGQGAKGTSKSRKGNPCTSCGTVTHHRFRIGDDLLCKACQLKA